MKITTWNINSIRSRFPVLENLIKDIKPDVLCLQETKVRDEFFPHDFFVDHGYEHRFIYGMKSYNGVAILSKKPFQASDKKDWCNKQDARHCYIKIDGIEIHNLYIPAGGDIPDPSVNEKFAHKLQFINELSQWFDQNHDDGAKKVILGDFNVAPLETDVWSHKQLLNVVSHTPIEVEYLDRLKKSCSWYDAARHFIHPDEKLYSWWSYRARDWRKSNRGRRLDHIWVSQNLRDALEDISFDDRFRDFEKPSDHIPVTLKIKI